MMINRGETQWGGRRSCSGPILIIFSFYQRVFGIWDYCLDRNMIFTFVTFFFNFRSWFNYKFAKSFLGSNVCTWKRGEWFRINFFSFYQRAFGIWDNCMDRDLTELSAIQARIQRGSSHSYITAMECKIITEMSLRQRNLHRIAVFMPTSALAIWLFFWIFAVDYIIKWWT